MKKQYEKPKAIIAQFQSNEDISYEQGALSSFEWGSEDSTNGYQN